MHSLPGYTDRPGAAYKSAKMAAHAFASVQLRHARCRVKLYCLMASVHTGDVASSAADAAFFVKHREYYASPFYVSMPPMPLMYIPFSSGQPDRSDMNLRATGFTAGPE